MKRAAIYVRTSSEQQGAKASPEEQEQDCRALAAQNDLEVVAVYSDIKRYRAKRRLVDPSGTRSDRPGLVAMMKAAKAGEIDVILTWREDRLYRGLRAMLYVLETIQEHKITIMLAKENFDEKMAPLKAWLAQMELDGMKERMTMGVKARLRAGKANTGQDRYGYRREGDKILIIEEEARWVRKIYEWYLDGVPKAEMRRRLIEADAPQKGGTIPRKIKWSRDVIDCILKGAESYCLGIKRYTRKGEVFEISIPPILDADTYQRYLEKREANKNYPAHNRKYNYLLGGLLYCHCDRLWAVNSTTRGTRINGKGERVGRQKRYWYYWCTENHKDAKHPDCAKTIGVPKADRILWNKVRDAINNPDILMGKARLHVAKLREQAESMTAEVSRIQEALDSLVMERQQIITWGRKRMITEEDMEYQLGAITMQELSLKRELTAQSEAANLGNAEEWEPILEDYFLDLQAGIESLDAKPIDKKEADEIFRLKKSIVDGLVKRVLIEKDKTLKVEIQVDVLSILKNAAKSDVFSILRVGTH